MGEENITFADLSHVISKEFKVLEDKIDAKFASYRNELQELAREPVTRENLDISDLPRGSAPTVGCTEQPSPTVILFYFVQINIILKYVVFTVTYVS